MNKKFQNIIQKDQWTELLIDAKSISQNIASSEIEIAAFSEAEAVRKATEILGVPKNQLTYVQISEGKNNWFKWFRIPSRYIFSVQKSVQQKNTKSEIDFNQYNDLAKNKNGSFKLLMRKKGLCLTVFPPQGIGKPIQIEDINKELKKRNYYDISTENIHRALNNLSKSFVIAPYIDSMYDSKFEIFLDPTNMLAQFMVTPPQQGGRIPEVNEIIYALHENNITYGIKEQYIREALENEIYNIRITAAEGTPVEQGADGYIEYLFLTSEDTIKYATRQDGSIDFKELNIIHNVRENDIIAIMHPSYQGKPGRTVTNEVINSVEGKSVEWNIGENVILSPTKLEAIAQISGQVFLKGNQLCVDKALQINSDVNLNVGNINFIGNIIIKGGVEDGFSVTSGGNIEIFGHIGKCFIKSEGNIIAHQGIQGNDEGQIICKGDLYARFIERTNLTIGNNLVVEKSLLHSNVLCEGGVYVIGDKKSIIAGGQVQAKKEIFAYQIGAESYIKTSLEVAYSETLLNEIKHFSLSVTEKENEILNLKNELTLKSKLINPNIIIQYEEKIKKLSIQIQNDEQKLALKKSELNELEIESNVSFENKIMPGVKIKIGAARLEINTQQGKGTLKKKGNNIDFLEYTPSPLLQGINTENIKSKKNR
ncbi:MAG: DUF342 domain-containing protein [Brevinemataceae bacterium]